MSLLVLGLNHQTAPVALRERISVSENQQEQTLRALLAVPGVRHAVLLSTCNRTEIYSQLDGEQDPQLARWLAEHHGLAPEALDEFIYRHRDEEAVKHLFRVAAGLDSMILGEPQIFGQVKQAWSNARQADSVHGVLDRLFQQTFATAKRIRTETRIGAHPVSVAYASVKLAKQLFSQLEQSTVMLIGAGETIELAAQHLANADVKRMIIANRTLEHAQNLASRFSAFALPLNDAVKHFHEADIIISATASPIPVISASDIGLALKQRRHKPMLLIDLAVPRDIESSVADFDDIYLYTVDDLDSVLEESRSFRQQAAAEAENLISLQVEHFFGELKALEHQGGLVRLRNRIESLRDHHIEKARLALARGEDAETVLALLAHQLSNKILHGPTLALRQAALDGDTDLLRAAEQLFRLDEDAQP
jgi:glutamyl-tRNA reductase